MAASNDFHVFRMGILAATGENRQGVLGVLLIGEIGQKEASGGGRRIFFTYILARRRGTQLEQALSAPQPTAQGK
jgi:hypothetical protein